MALDEMNLTYTPWSLLQQPAHSGQGLTASFRSLLAAIDLGWQVEQPVQVLPSTQSELWTYYFVLTHPVTGQSCWLFIPAAPEVERFVDQNEYSVIEGSYY